MLIRVRALAARLPGAGRWEAELLATWARLRGRMFLPDQDLLNAYFRAHPALLYVLPCEWNFRADSYCPVQTSAVGLLHGNRGAFVEKGEGDAGARGFRGSDRCACLTSGAVGRKDLPTCGHWHFRRTYLKYSRLGG